MISHQSYARAAGLLPLLNQMEKGFVHEFQSITSLARVPRGRVVFEAGDCVETLALLLSGRVRVYKIGETGRELTLYRFGAGEFCVLSANAILSRKSFSAMAAVEEEAEAVMIPAEAFRDWVRRYDTWREYLFDLLSARLTSLISIIDEVTFQRVDARVAAFLLTHAHFANPFLITHHAIADELGSSREVISRILEGFSQMGLIRLTRGEIKVLDFTALQFRSHP